MTLWKISLGPQIREHARPCQPKRNGQGVPGHCGSERKQKVHPPPPDRLRREATGGRILIESVDTSMLSPGRTTTLRREKIGFVFQAFNLIPVFTATENVEFPLLVQGVGSGERQRVAVARAIVHRNAQVLADEPTANLDAHNAAQLIDLMCDLNRCLGLTFIFSTHDQRLLEDTDRIVRLSDGLAASDIRTAATHLANDLQGLSLKHQHPGSAVVPHAAMA